MFTAHKRSRRQSKDMSCPLEKAETKDCRLTWPSECTRSGGNLWLPEYQMWPASGMSQIKGIRKNKNKKKLWEREKRNEKLKANQEYSTIFILLISYE
jgi:hypothetical protein